MPQPTIAVVNSDPALLALLDELLTETDYTVTTYLTEATTYPALQKLQPDQIILDVGMQAAAAGWPLLKLLQFDPSTMHIPVLVSMVDHQFVRDKADFLATKGYHVLELPASFATLATCSQWERPASSRMARTWAEYDIDATSQHCRRVYEHRPFLSDTCHGYWHHLCPRRAGGRRGPVALFALAAG